jgi:hypothetical protein
MLSMVLYNAVTVANPIVHGLTAYIAATSTPPTLTLQQIRRTGKGGNASCELTLPLPWTHTGLMPGVPSLTPHRPQNATMVYTLLLANPLVHGLTAYIAARPTPPPPLVPYLIPHTYAGLRHGVHSLTPPPCALPGVSTPELSGMP